MKPSHLFLSCLLALLLLSSPLGAEEVPEQYKKMQNPNLLTPDKYAYFYSQYLGKCARCHGEKGDGGGKEYKHEPGYADPANFTDAAFMKSKLDGELYYQIEMGGEEVSAMPAFGPDSAAGWSEEKIWQMVSFVRLFSQHPEIIQQLQKSQ